MVTPSVSAMPTFEPESGQFAATLPDSMFRGRPMGITRVVRGCPGGRASVVVLTWVPDIPGPPPDGGICTQPDGTCLVPAKVTSNEDSSIVELTPGCRHLHGGHAPSSGHQHHDGRAGADRNAFRRCGAVILGALLLPGRLPTIATSADNPLDP